MSEVWVSDPNGMLRKQAEILLTKYGEILGPLNLKMILFFRTLGNSDIRKKGMTYKLNPPHSQLIEAYIQQFGEAHGLTGITGEQPYDIRFAITLYDDHHSSDADRLHTLLHELYHIDSSMLKLRDHDLKTHSWMIQRFGLDASPDLSEFEQILKGK